MSSRIIPFTVLALGLALSAIAGPPSQDQLKKQRDEKLAEGWVTKFPWNTDYAKAKEEAKKSGKAIFAYFSRSYSP
ncbi:MAG: thioredoxin family protein [Planctomycetes bacterium]|nr:thioredoxin family protein [Planctomycetota bacterium]